MRQGGRSQEGPTVSFDPILGGLNVHITDRSGVTSQCTYDADGFTRTFRLEANSSTDLKIVPAVPSSTTEHQRHPRQRHQHADHSVLLAPVGSWLIEPVGDRKRFGHAS